MTKHSEIRVFYVEDEPSLAKIVKETLESKGYHIHLFNDGEIAATNYVKGAFDICILDIMLPNKSGYEVAQVIRKIDMDIPIIFLTAKDQSKDVVKGFDVGGNEYIRKPFSIEELIVRINNLLSIMTRSQSENKYVAIGKEFTFYPDRLELHYHDEVQKLSYRESQILFMLTKESNQVIHRKDILLEVWNDDSFYNSRNLDVYITKLRNYLKKAPNVKILTLKGVGYQFVNN